MQLEAYEHCTRTRLMCTFLYSVELQRMLNTTAHRHFVRPPVLGGIDGACCV